MSDEYTPTTEDVRDAYTHGAALLPPYYSDGFQAALAGRRAEFDRWLAAHDREVAARAWDEGYEAGRENALAEPGSGIPGSNPYRVETGELHPAS